LPGLLPVVLRFALGRADRGELKGRLIAALLGALEQRDLDAWNARYVPALLQRGVFAAALARIAAHRDAGDHLILMSASVDLYVPEIGRRLGFDATICSGVAWRDGRVAGPLSSANCRDQEKARCLREVAAQLPALPITAYGNSGSDLPHLVLAQHAVLINANAKLRRAAEATGHEFEFAAWT
jgi:phosphatidylglycerophosphatase C